MRINCNKSDISLSGHMRISQIRKIIKTSPSEVENLLHKEGISCNFRGNVTVAALNLYTVQIFKFLNLPVPSQLIYGTSKYKNTSSILAETFFGKFCATKEKDIIKPGGIVFYRQKEYKSPILFDNKCNKKFKKEYGTEHFLNTFVHEYMHSLLYRNIINAEKTNELSFNEVYEYLTSLKIYTFKDEISKKIGKYGSKNLLELHAVYWAKEICDCLGHDLLPRYNPFKSPRISLSPLLKRLINSVSDVNIEDTKNAIFESQKFDEAIKKAIKSILNQGVTDKSKPL